MTTYVARGHAKLILSGEHAVVYGHPAIAIAVDRGTSVSVWQRPGPTATDAATPCDERLSQALLRAMPPTGWCVKVDSDVPIGRGMGSSAALSVGLVRAMAMARQQAPTDQHVFDASLDLERVFHGTPSGLDNAVSARGGALRYTKGPPPTFTSLPCPSWPIVVLDSGSAGDTAKLVAGVRARRPQVDPLLDAIGELVGHVQTHLHDPATVGPLLTRNHELLRDLGVSNDILDGLVQLALDHGALGAKLAGAGGGGVVIALATDPQRLLRAADSAGVTAFVCHPTPRAHA